MTLASEINRLFAESKSLLSQKNWDKALEVNERILKLLEKGGVDGRAKAGALTNIGLIHYQKGDFPESVRFLEQSLELKKKLEDKRFLVTTLMNLARAYRATCQYANGKGTLDELLILSKELNSAELEKQVNAEMIVDEKTRNREPVVYTACVGISTDDTVWSNSNFEYLPLLFNELRVVIDEISWVLDDHLSVTIIIHFENIEKEIEDPYLTDKWKVEAKYPVPMARDETPNLIVFLEQNMLLSIESIRITDEKDNSVIYDQERGSPCVWVVFTPNSYPLGGYGPMPICENFHFFRGLGQIFNWELNIKRRYAISFETSVKRNKPEQEIQIGMLLPFRSAKIQTSNISIKTEKPTDNSTIITKGRLKLIPYTSSRGPVEIVDYFDFAKEGQSFDFQGDTFYTLKKAGLGGTESIELKDYRVLCFDLVLSKKKRILMVSIDEIDSFSKVVGVSAESVENLVPLPIKEEEIKKRFQEIIGEPFSQKDWGGERSDQFTTRVLLKGRREPAAFIYKGKAYIDRPLMISDLGTRGDQVIRLFNEPAKIYFLQCNGRIDSQVYDMMKTYAEKKAREEEIFYCIIDGVDTARVLRAYDKI